MNTIGIMRVLTYPLALFIKSLNLNKRFKLRSVTEVVIKLEDLRYKFNKAEASNDEKSSYYRSCIEVLEWVLNGHQSKE